MSTRLNAFAHTTGHVIRKLSRPLAILLLATALTGVASAASPAPAAVEQGWSTVRGEKTIGLLAGYVTRNSSPVAGVDFTYRMSRHFRLEASADYIFRHHGEDAFGLNLNAQFPIALNVSRKWEIYPMAGLNFSMFNRKKEITSEMVANSNRVNRLGLNAGAGVDYNVSSTMRLSLEGQATLLKGYSYGSFAASIAYIF